MSRPLFISYSRSDHSSLVPLLAELRAAGFDPWLDQTSIPVSVPWFDEIQKAIRSSELVVVVDTPAWRASANCQAELRVAEGLEKVVVGLTPPQSDRWLAAIRNAYSGLPVPEIAYARLLGDSYRWQSAGRRRTHLASGRLLKEYRRMVRSWPQRDALAGAFVAKSLRASRLRALRAALATALTVSLFVGFQTSWALHDELTKRDQERAAELAITSTVNARLRMAPYSGVEQALDSARQAGSGSYVANAALASALEVNLPVSIENPSGRPPGAASALGDTSAEHGTLRAVLDSAANLVRVTGPLSELSIPASGAVTAMAWSPDGGRLAIADAGGVSIVRVPQGRTIAVLRGLEGAVDQLDWSSEARIVGRAGQLSATWQLPGTLLAKTKSWFMGLSANNDGSKALAIGREGTFTLISGTQVVASAPIKGLTASAVTWTGDRWAISGQLSTSDGLVAVVDAGGHLSRTWPSIGCVSTSIAPGPDGTVLLACTAAQVIRELNLETGATRDVRVPEAQPVNAILDQDGSVLVTTVYDELVRVAQATPTLLKGGVATCAMGAGIVVPSPDRSRVLVGGQTPVGCTSLSLDPSNRGTTHTLVARGAQLSSMRSAVWSRDGDALVMGWASGELWFFDPVVYADRLIISPTGSEIRGIAFNSDQSALVVVTRDGEVISFPTDAPLGSFDQRISVLESRLQIGIDAGLAKD